MKIYRETVSEMLWQVLNRLMQFKELQSFRLVGGTSLSLLLGHRISADIDLFSDAEYNSIDFCKLDKLMVDSFQYVEFSIEGNDSFGKSYFIGNTKEDAVKVDMFYTDKFQYPLVDYQGIRISQPKETIAMKIEVIGQNGRKKDFWDIHELMEHYSISEMLSFYKKRYPYGHKKEEILSKLTNFQLADNDLDPICLKGKYWELIKLDIEEAIVKFIK